jgi:DNA adenine methylase
MNTPTRPALRYHGGKWKLASWIISFFPAHRVYVEPYGGAASVLLQKPRSYSEIYNDLDGEIVNLFRVLRDPVMSEELIKQVYLTPFAREEFEESHLPSMLPVEKARRTLVRSFMGYGSNLTSNKGTSFRCAGMTKRNPSNDWATLPDGLRTVVSRLQGVSIERQSAIDLIERFDDPSVLYYVDPPYPQSTRGDMAFRAYRYEMTDSDHRKLAPVLHNCKGMVILSGYGCELYDQELYSDWYRGAKDTYADGANERTEVLWLNESAYQKGMPLFNFNR